MGSLPHAKKNGSRQSDNFVQRRCGGKNLSGKNTHPQRKIITTIVHDILKIMITKSLNSLKGLGMIAYWSLSDENEFVYL